jgi:DNA-binding PadR family transcriptional regulator
MAVTTLGYALLGLLSRESCSGYDLGRHLKEPVSFFWQARYSQIYPELAKLEEQGLVTHTNFEQQGLPDKKIYAITAEGRETLQRWVVAPMDLPAVRDELILKAYSLWLADPHAALTLFRTHEQYHRERLEQFETFQREIEEQEEELQDITSPLFASYATLQAGLGFEREYIAWCNWIATRLERAIARQTTQGKLEAGSKDGLSLNYGGTESQDHFPTKIRQNSTVQEATS